MNDNTAIHCSLSKDEILVALERIRDRHRDKLNALKENRCFESDNYSAAEGILMDEYIASLAHVLSDINREIFSAPIIATKFDVGDIVTCSNTPKESSKQWFSGSIIQINKDNTVDIKTAFVANKVRYISDNDRPYAMICTMQSVPVETINLLYKFGQKIN